MTMSQQTTSNFTNDYLLDSEDIMTVKPNSEKIREFLKDDTLREIIYNIDNAARGPEVDEVLDATRRNDEVFFNFTEEILNLVLPQDSDS
ncbi:4037_t:CDS:2 [Diversispora eburnea]|uniref:4037_t:CDS:1 n=1 Tax=Diversispora eburnea TaxID=1213867 RepID=A0A9N8ZYP4_9GLOM|nr:4037_t:CDS:2 [Diversispora eburnea]